MVTLTPTGSSPAERRTAFLLRVGHALGSSLDYERTLESIALLAVPELADHCSVHLRQGDEIRTLATRSADPARAALALEWLARSPPRLDDAMGIGQVVREGKPVHALRITPQMRRAAVGPAMAELADRLAVVSALVVPLVAAGQPVGAISLSTAESGRHFGPDDVALAEDLARQASIAIENARLHRETRDQARRAAFLDECSRRLASTLDPGRTLRELLEVAVPTIADWGVVYLRRPDGRVDRVALHHADPALAATVDEIRRRWVNGPEVVGHLAEAVREGRSSLVVGASPDLFGRGAVDAEHERALRRLGLAAFVIVPLLHRGEVLGALALVASSPERVLGADDLRLAEEVGRRAGAALDNARVHDRLARLQHVTSRLTGPQTPGEVAAILVREASATVGAANGVLSLLDPHEGSIDLLLMHEAPMESLRPFARMRIDADLPVAQAIRERRDIFVESREQLHAAWSGAREAALRTNAWAVLPLFEGERVMGALWFGFAHPRAFAPDERAFLRALADQGAQAFARSRLEQAALVRQELLESQSEAALDGIFFQDTKGRPAFFNRRLLELFGVPADVPERASLAERLAATMDRLADPEGFRELVLRMEREPDAALRQELELRDGRILDAYTTPVRAPSGERLGRAWYYRDVTDARRMQAELLASRAELAHREKLAALGTLVSGVAHEVRTPLAYMANQAFLLTRLVQQARSEGLGDAGLERLASAAQSIEEGVERINRLVHDLRRFAKLDAAAQEADFDASVAAASRLFDATHRADVRFEARVGASARVRVDPTHLQQVVLNLLENAADASPAGGRVRLSTRAEAPWAVLTVEDEGPGIPSDVQARMFEPFYTTKPGGTGLGLAIVRRIVESSKGHLDVDSTPGKGTRFEVRFPLA